MRKVPIKSWSTSKFVNPFVCGSFFYNQKEYDCGDSHIQTLLYMYMYGLNTSKAICSLFYIMVPQGIIQLPWRRLSKLMYRIDQTNGWEHLDEYTTMMDTMYRDALKDNMVLDYKEKQTFNHGTKTSWDSWVKVWIHKNYPSIMNELGQKYKDIKIFID